MKIAWNEITYQPKKFVLIEFLIAALIFMVVSPTSSPWLVNQVTQASS